jgi:hypothetical protein
MASIVKIANPVFVNPQDSQTSSVSPTTASHKAYSQGNNLPSQNKPHMDNSAPVIVSTKALFVMTPDGVVHAKHVNKDGTVSYTPNINMESFSHKK